MQEQTASEAFRLELEYEDTSKLEKNVPSDPIRPAANNPATRRFVVTSERVAPTELSFKGMTLYCPPRQIKRWDEDEIEQKVDWGNLFFDLFFVAATYNVSYILTSDPYRNGFLYAVGTFFPVMGFWERKAAIHCRFNVEDDILHRILKAIELLVLATAVLHIRPKKYMSDLKNDFSMFGFALSMTISRILYLLQNMELYYFAVGQRQAIQQAAKGLFSRYLLIETTFFAAATILAGYHYYLDDDDGSLSKSANESYAYNSSYHRDLAAVEESNTTTDESSYIIDAPIWLMLAGHVASVLCMQITILFCFPADGRHKEFNVPMHIDFYMHRNGEWTMLMLGESIVSLLIVDVSNESKEFYTTFLFGVLSVIFLYFLHFASQPYHANQHALRRSKNTGIVWGALQQIYSMALVTLGAVFTLYLAYLGAEDGSEVSADFYEIRDQANRLFCIALGTIFATLDLMTLLHLGSKGISDRCKCKDTKNIRIAPIIFGLVRVAFLGFTFTMNQWEANPRNLSVIAAFNILVQLFFRHLGDKFGQGISSFHADH
ncbi:hypothetical protein FisN_24Lh006 [Fistulifera solaris]|uniref:Uncharacterized protein n=1 Tax=Fistulifera solaris TaxID=1519565 RepID=A0A1Z5JAP2_FISSO|nr:hypothetical protein FisN_24Lh006 [Fistulifera solaris]|eukprot:GAX11057.1 hypothetical protein FisN_24Lh006 [Fistulifera solaris]